MLEPIVSSEVLLSYVLASQIESKDKHERDTSVNPSSLEAVQPSRWESPEELPHYLLLVWRNGVQYLTTGTL